jgi:hypothetical protein
VLGRNARPAGRACQGTEVGGRLAFISRDGQLKRLLAAVTGATPDSARASWLSGFRTLPSP